MNHDAIAGQSIGGATSLHTPSALLYTDSDVFAGTERHILELAGQLRALGANVSIACPAGSPLALAAARDAIPVVLIEKRGFVDFTAIARLRKLLASREVDVIHAHNGRTALATGLAIQLARRGAGVTTQHFIDPSRGRRGGLKGILSRAAHGWLSGRMAHSIAVSMAARDAMIRRRDTSPGQITVVPNGISVPDTAAFPSASALRRELSMPDSAPLIVCVARLEEEKDIATLIDAMRGVHAAVPDAHCVICGDGSQHAALAARIQEHALGACVTLAGFRQDALAWIRAADLFVLPSRAEPFGLVLLEAMALGVPVVATRAGGPLEIVDDGRTGLLATPGDPSALAAALLRLLGDSSLRMALGRAGFLRYQERFTATAMARATLAVYRAALQPAL